MSGAVLSVEGLTVSLPKGADRANAVEDIDLAVAAGEIVCVVGESGSGKSVTAFTVMGLQDSRALKPVAGRIMMDGEDLLRVGRRRLRKLRGEKMSMIFQEPMTALNPVARVGDQIGEMLEIHTDLSASGRKTRVIAAMEDVGLPDPASMYRAFPHQLSGGQRQRIMIAMALVLEPDLLIADEPTTALDVTTQAQILDLIKDIQARRGMGVLFITHDFGVVADIADRVVVMQHGRIVEQGLAEQVLRAPEHPYTKMLMEAVPSMTPPEREAATGAETLVVEGLDKTYGHRGLLGGGRLVHAAKSVDFALRRGETLGIVGESGSGKSTVARCVMRLIDPTSGRVLLDGRDIAGLSQGALRPVRRDIQVVFQDPYRSLNPRRNVGQSITEGPVNFGTPQAEAMARAEELMRVVGLDPDALERFPHQFSGGQRQRIAIARALAMQPHVLIADEAVSALDVSVQAQVLDLLDDVRDRFDLAMLFITHDLRVAAQICDRILVMRQGEVVEQGPTADVYANPQHDYTRALLAAAPGAARLTV
ncbi:ABC transporter ATP-binding protein [Jannaschia aquimarina]|uniref:GsiA_5 protein n=1 Tax=Jannaschia aquimarina TaxID=935700 RepID=A0A0D1CJW8_9RHOB|nr:ABC transporter ATP-binding protein [Jannaschia aquimarina]KIT15042.1 Glutathione import ATP-binding protein GsiA [Jannaschia aquimarina]SNS62616.1 peptide/nickel transport system ATP-binding protein [Jannaschia aquimarina]